MLSNGYKLREMLRAAELTLEMFVAEFESSKNAFEGETKRKLIDVSNDIKSQELLVAKLQELQQQYNQNVNVKVQGKDMTLTMAVKLQGGAGRQSKMWRVLAGEKKNSRNSYYDREEMTRSKDNIYANPTYTKIEALAKANEFSAYAGALRAAVAVGNNTEFNFPELDGLALPQV